MKKSTAAVILAVTAVILIGLTFAAFVGFPVGIYDVNPLQSVVQKGAETEGAYAVLYKASGDVTESQLDEAVAIFAARLNAAGYDTAAAARCGADTVLVTFPRADYASYFLQYLGNVGEITFTNDSDEIVIQDGMIAKADYMVSSGAPYLYITFNAEGKQAFTDATRAAAISGKGISIKLDGTTLSTNSVSSAITTGTCGISFYGADAVSAISKVGKKLPAAFAVDSSFTMRAAAGANGATLLAYGGIALTALALIFFIFRYKSFSIAPIVSLWLFVILTLVVLALDIAGIDLTIATAAAVLTAFVLFVMTQALVFEGIYGQRAVGKPVRAAFKAGFAEGMARARYINYALFVAAMAVFAFGTAGFKQFSVMLMIGIALGMLLTTIVTRGIGNCVLAFRNNVRK
ncbi:MAG: hypothetical protein KIG36_01710 [Eubacteriales bacterium]|nr:hypothetical protein [Eubacteriales bacterium]